jgi:hypothetical protein
MSTRQLEPVADRANAGAARRHESAQFRSYLQKGNAHHSREVCRVLVTSPATFSAGITMTAFVKAAGGDRVTILREPVGDRLAFFSEGSRACLPHFQLCMNYQTGKYNYAGACHDLSICYWLNYIYPVRVPSLSQDETISTSFEDWNAGARSRPRSRRRPHRGEQECSSLANAVRSREGPPIHYFQALPPTSGTAQKSAESPIKIALFYPLAIRRHLQAKLDSHPLDGAFPETPKAMPPKCL